MSKVGKRVLYFMPACDSGSGQAEAYEGEVIETRDGRVDLRIHVPGYGDATVRNVAQAELEGRFVSDPPQPIHFLPLTGEQADQVLETVAANADAPAPADGDNVVPFTGDSIAGVPDPIAAGIGGHSAPIGESFAWPVAGDGAPNEAPDSPAAAPAETASREDQP